MSTAAPAAARATCARHRRQESRPLDRDEGLRLRKLERAITLRLALYGQQEAYCELSESLDAFHAHERLDALAAITDDDIADVLVHESERMDGLREVAL